MKRLVIANSAIFDNPDNKYDVTLFSRLVKEAGGKEITIECNFGWSNQPDVVTFDGDTNMIAPLIEKLNQHPPFNHSIAGPIIQEVDWP